MKRVVLGIILFLSITTYVNARTVLPQPTNADQFDDIPVKMGSRILTIQINAKDKNDYVMVLPQFSTPSKTEKEYFEILTLVTSLFIKSYRIGKLNKKSLSFFIGADLKNYPYRFDISVNNLKLVNKRDFDKEDMSMAFDTNDFKLYPLKEVLKKGKFIGRNSSNMNDIKTRYHKFLKNYEFPGLLESRLEWVYEKNKTR